MSRLTNGLLSRAKAYCVHSGLLLLVTFGFAVDTANTSLASGAFFATEPQVSLTVEGVINTTADSSDSRGALARGTSQPSALMAVVEPNDSLAIPANSSALSVAAAPDSTGEALAHHQSSLNMMWTLIAGFLVMFMQAGFALLETGLCRAKNAAHVMSMNFLVYALGILGFWVCGFALMFGGYASGPSPIGWHPSLGEGIHALNHEQTLNVAGKSFGLFGKVGFFLNPSAFGAAVFCLFFFQTVFMDTAATIPTGAMAERWNFRNFMLYGVWVGMFPYALFGNWVWGGGWLAQLGQNFGWGHGHVDFAGSSVVHLCGGTIALVGAMVLGARLGKFGRDGKARPMPGHNLVYVVLGTFILAFGWFGFNAGSTLSGTENRIAIIAVNTMLSSAAGALASCLVMYRLTGKPDPSMMCNGLLGGLVAVTAPCAFVSPTAAVIIGAVAGVLVVVAIIFVERDLHIDDPVGAVSVHGACGFWGVLSLGLFANGSYGHGWNGVHKLFKGGAVQIINNDGDPKTVKLYSGLIDSGWLDQGVTGALGKAFGAAYNDWSQLGAQITGASACLLFVGGFAYLWFKFSDWIIPIRSDREDEMTGLDIPEMGADCYSDPHFSDKSIPPFR